MGLANQSMRLPVRNNPVANIQAKSHSGIKKTLSLPGVGVFANDGTGNY